MIAQETALQLMGGTDGFRDEIVPGDDPGRLNPATAGRLAVAFAETLPVPATELTCVVGGDTRPSTPALQEAVIAGAASTGAKVIDMGVSPTPAIQWVAAHEMAATMSVSVTASHNPAKDNGIKLMYGAEKPDSDRIEDYSTGYWQLAESSTSIPTKNADIAEDPSHLKRYKQAIITSIESDFGERPLEGKLFAVDGANGAAMGVTPAILAELGAEVKTFACDGSRPINDHSGAAHLEGVKAFLRDHPDIVEHPGFVGAVSNDGDGDRLMGVGARIVDGEIVFDDIDGNRVMELLAEGQPGIVGTEYTNPATRRRLAAREIPFEECKNGDRYVTEKLRQLGWKRGGEFTGHLIDLDWLPSGDGVRMAAWLAAHAASKGKTFAELADGMPLDPEKMLNVKMGRHNTAELSRPDVIAEIEAAKSELGDSGRIVVRRSGTESLYRIWAAGEDQEQIEGVVGKIATTLAFPKILATELSEIAIEDLDEDGQDALRQLREKDYDVRVNLRAEDLPEVADIADQKEVKKRCPGDGDKRFGRRATPQEQRIAMAKAWHEKGRLPLQLRRGLGAAGLAGHGWTGPDGKGRLTFAVRMNEEDAGQGIGTLFTRVIVSHTRMRTGGAAIHLETDTTNRSVNTYTKAGAIAVGEPVAYRRPAGWDELDQADADGMVEDYRQDMVFPAVTAA